MLENYLKVVVTLTVTVLAFVCLVCLILDRLTYVGDLFGLTALVLAAVAYLIHLE